MTAPGFTAGVVCTFRNGGKEIRRFPVRYIKSNFVFLADGDDDYGPFCLAPDDATHQHGAYLCSPPPCSEVLTRESVDECLAWQAAHPEARALR